MNPERASVLLTGATGGIGRCIARRLAEAGARIFLTARRKEPLLDLAEAIDTGDRGVVSMDGDISDAAFRDRLASAALDWGVNVVIHGAGVNRSGLFEDLSEDEIRRLMDVNMLAPMLLTRVLLPGLRRRLEAQLLFIGSGFGALAYPGFVSYSASKFALRGFAEGLRRELGDSAVRVSLLVPRAVDTSLNDAATRRLQARFAMRVDSPDRVARAAVTLLKKPRPEAHLGWPDRLFFGINRLRPALVDGALRGKLPEIRRLLRSGPDT